MLIHNQDKDKCTFTTVIYVNCCNKGARLPLLEDTNTSVSWANDEKYCDSKKTQRDNVNAMYMFLDLSINTNVFGICSILIGFYFLTTNYQQSKKTKNRLNWMVCSINGTCFVMLILFLTILRNDFNLLDDLKFLALGLLLG